MSNSVTIQKSVLVILANIVTNIGPTQTYSPVTCTSQYVNDTIWTNATRNLDGWMNAATFSNVRLHNGQNRSDSFIAGPYNISTYDLICNTSVWRASLFADVLTEYGSWMTTFPSGAPAYDHIIILMPNEAATGIDCGGSLVAPVPGSWSFIFECNVSILYAHAIMHNLGLGHAGNNTCPCTAYPLSSCNSSLTSNERGSCYELGDVSDAMGGGYDISLYSDFTRTLNGVHMVESGWLNSSKILNVSDIYSYAGQTVFNLSLSNSISVIIIPDIINNRYLFVSCLQQSYPYTMTDNSSIAKLQLFNYGNMSSTFMNDYQNGTNSVLLSQWIRDMRPGLGFAGLLAHDVKLVIARNSTDVDECNFVMHIVQFASLIGYVGLMTTEFDTPNKTFEDFWIISKVDDITGLLTGELYDLTFAQFITPPIPGSLVTLTGAFSVRDISKLYPFSTNGLYDADVVGSPQNIIVQTYFIDDSTVGANSSITIVGHWITSTTFSGYNGSYYYITSDMNSTLTFSTNLAFDGTYYCDVTAYWMNLGTNGTALATLYGRDGNYTFVIAENYGTAVNANQRKLYLGNYAFSNAVVKIIFQLFVSGYNISADAVDLYCVKERDRQIGTKTALFILVNTLTDVGASWNSNISVGCTGATIGNIFNNTISTHYLNSSYNEFNLDIQNSRVLTLSNVNISNHGDCVYTDWAMNIINLLLSTYPSIQTRNDTYPPLSGIRIPDFNHIIFVIPNTGCPWKSVSNILDSLSFIVDCQANYAAPFIHTIGHHIGLSHSGTIACPCLFSLESDCNTCSLLGDSSDLMAWSYPSPDNSALTTSYNDQISLFDGPQRFGIGWLRPERVTPLYQPDVSIASPQYVCMDPLEWGSWTNVSSATIYNVLSTVSVSNPDLFYVTCRSNIHSSVNQTILQIHIAHGSLRYEMAQPHSTILLLKTITTYGDFYTTTIDTGFNLTITLFNATNRGCLVLLQTISNVNQTQITHLNQTAGSICKFLDNSVPQTTTGTTGTTAHHTTGTTGTTAHHTTGTTGTTARHTTGTTAHHTTGTTGPHATTSTTTGRLTTTGIVSTTAVATTTKSDVSTTSITTGSNISPIASEFGHNGVHWSVYFAVPGAIFIMIFAMLIIISIYKTNDGHNVTNDYSSNVNENDDSDDDDVTENRSSDSTSLKLAVISRGRHVYKRVEN